MNEMTKQKTLGETTKEDLLLLKAGAWDLEREIEMKQNFLAAIRQRISELEKQPQELKGEESHGADKRKNRTPANG